MCQPVDAVGNVRKAGVKILHSHHPAGTGLADEGAVRPIGIDDPPAAVRYGEGLVDGVRQTVEKGPLSGHAADVDEAGQNPEQAQESKRRQGA